MFCNKFITVSNGDRSPSVRKCDHADHSCDTRTVDLLNRHLFKAELPIPGNHFICPLLTTDSCDKTEKTTGWKMKIERRRQAPKTADATVLLEDNLRPIWTFLRYNGFLPDFLRQRYENGAFHIARCVFTSLVLLFMICDLAFKLRQLFFVDWTNDLPHFAFTVVFLLHQLNGFLVSYQFLMHGREFRQFFQDWKKVEMDYGNHFTAAKKKTIKSALIFNLLLGTQTLIGFFWSYTTPDAPMFVTSLPFANSALDILLLSLVSFATFYYTWMNRQLGEAVASIFFYHAGCVIEGLERELRDLSDNLVYRSNAQQPHRIWQRYENVYRLVGGANRLFQAVILAHYFVSFSSISTAVFFSIKMYDEKPSLVLGITVCLAAFIMQCCLINRLLSHLYLSQRRLRDAVAVLLCRKWYLLPKETRLFLISFQDRLDKDRVAAAPFALFTVNPTNLSGLLSLCVTYAVVLLQS